MLGLRHNVVGFERVLKGCRGVDLRVKVEEGDDAQDIQEPEGPKTEVLEVLAVLVD